MEICGEKFGRVERDLLFTWSIDLKLDVKRSYRYCLSTGWEIAVAKERRRGKKISLPEFLLISTSDTCDVIKLWSASPSIHSSQSFPREDWRARGIPATSDSLLFIRRSFLPSFFLSPVEPFIAAWLILKSHYNRRDTYASILKLILVPFCGSPHFAIKIPRQREIKRDWRNRDR